MSTASHSPGDPTCPRCGGPVHVDARFCKNCGAPQTLPGAVPLTLPEAEPPTLVPAAPPLAQRPSPRGRIWPFAVGAAALAALCLCVCVMGVLFLGPRFISTPPAPVTESGDAVDPKGFQALEKSVDAIQAACRAGDADAVIQLTHPALRPTYQPILSAHRTDLKRLADLLSTRKLTNMTDDMAEYQVTEGGQTYYVTFEAWGGQWYLSTL